MPSIKLLSSSGAVLCQIFVLPCNRGNQGVIRPIMQSHQGHCIKCIIYLMTLSRQLTVRQTINKLHDVAHSPRH